MCLVSATISVEEAAGASPAYWSSERGDAEVDFLMQGAEDVPLYAVGRIVAETGSGRLI